MPTYDNPIRITYQLDAATISASADLLKFVGPAGLQGKIAAMSSVVTTAVTVAATLIDVGTAGDDDAFAEMTVPISSADAVLNTFTNHTDDDNLLAADTLVVISAGGECTAGAANITLTIDWF